LKRQFPDINVVGTYTPPFRHMTKDEESDFIHIVDRSHPDILWVGMSTPKQERFMAKYNGRLPVGLMVGVGAAFDINSGSVKDAPAWMKSAGLQWLYRMLKEPRRLAGRYLKNNPRFLWLASLQLAGIRKYQLS
jgi:N-acetylglucosaminyldiphosphoundecaprenol N-acetyl-beta-D-mannosaminyltransferase